MRLQNQKALTRTEEGRGVNDGVGYESRGEGWAIVIRTISYVSEEIDHGVLRICEQRLMGFRNAITTAKKETPLEVI